MKALPANFTMRDIFDFCNKHNLENLAQGMIELPPPQKLRERTADICLHRDEIHQYRNRMGEMEFREGIVSFLEKNYCVKASTDSILATSGVCGAICSTLLTLRNERGSDVKAGLMVPFYTYHQKQIQELLSKEPIYVNTNDDFTPNWEAIETALKGGLDILIFTNPGNPQGNVWKKDDVRRIVELTKQYKTMLLIDEIYCDLVFVGELFSPINDELHDNVIVCRGFSKTLAAQSWRVGYMVSHPSVIARVMRIHDPIYISVPWMQHAFAKYLTDDYADFVRYVKELSKLFQDNWKILSKAFQKVLDWEPIEPEGSMYGMFKHKSKSDKEAIALGLQYGVGVAPGNIFFPKMPENTGYTRIHCGITAEKAKEIVKMIEERGAKLKST